jgi:hypothetical protein
VQADIVAMATLAISPAIVMRARLFHRTATSMAPSVRAIERHPCPQELIPIEIMLPMAQG